MSQANLIYVYPSNMFSQIVFVNYFFMTNVLLYDLYDRQGNTDGQCIETKEGKVCELKNRSYETDAYKSRK